MILHFSDLNKLRTILMGDFIPPEVLSKPCMFGYEEDGSIYVQTDEKMDQTQRAQLRELGVKGTRKKSSLTNSVNCWAEIFSAIPSGDPNPTSTVLFKLPKSLFVSFVTEMANQGHLAQQYAFVEDFVLCRAVDPPYYIVLKLLSNKEITSFHEIPHTGFWVESGYTHPLIERMRPEKNMILIPKEGSWIRVPLLEWKEVYDYTSFTVPNETTFTCKETSNKIDIPLQLLQTSQSRSPTLWVLREDAYSQVENFVRTVSDSEISKYSYNVFEHEGNEIVVLKSRSIKNPPVLNLKAESYMAINQVPWLYVPENTMINPPLRPSTLKEIFNHDGNLVWLAPQDTKRRKIPFKVEYVSEDFLPLSQWVHYVVSKHEKPLNNWKNSVIFDFESFVDRGLEWSEGPKKKKKKKKESPKEETPSEELMNALSTIISDDGEGESFREEIEITIPSIEVSEQEARLTELTELFCKEEASWDDPSRIPTWVELGNIHASMNKLYQAVLCWTRAVWISEDPLPILQSWSSFLTSHYGITDIHESLNKQNPSFQEILAVCVWTIVQSKTSKSVDDLEGIQNFLQIHTHTLDQRLFWLTSLALSDLSGGDPLLLASSFDSIVSNNTSISIREIPVFIRSQEQGFSISQIQNLLEEHLTTYLENKKTFNNETFPKESLDALVRLLFALAFAKTGQRNRTQEEMSIAKKILDKYQKKEGYPIWSLFYDSLEEKIKQALNGEADKEWSSEISQKTQELNDFEIYQWSQISRIWSFGNNVFRDPFATWKFKDVEFNFRSNLEYGLAAKNYIVETLDWIASNSLNLPEKRAVFDIICNAVHFIDYKEVPTTVKNLLKTIQENGLPVSYYGSLVKIFHRYGLTDTAKTFLTMSLNENLEEDRMLESLLPLVENSKYFLELDCRNLLEQLKEKWENIISQKKTALEDSSLTSLERRNTMRDEKILSLWVGVLSRYLYNKEDLLSQAINEVFDIINVNDLLKGDEEDAASMAQYKWYIDALKVAANSSSPEMAMRISYKLISLLPGSRDALSLNRKITSVSTLNLMDKTIFSIVNDSLILSDFASDWVSKDEAMLFSKIQSDMRK